MSQESRQGQRTGETKCHMQPTSSKCTYGHPSSPQPATSPTAPEDPLIQIDVNEDDQFDSAGILTQFIGPSIMTTSTNPTDNTEEDEDTARVAKEIESLKSQYLDSTQVLDRATNHFLREATQAGTCLVS